MLSQKPINCPINYPRERNETPLSSIENKSKMRNSVLSVSLLFGIAIDSSISPFREREREGEESPLCGRSFNQEQPVIFRERERENRLALGFRSLIRIDRKQWSELRLGYCMKVTEGEEANRSFREQDQRTDYRAHTTSAIVCGKRLSFFEDLPQSPKVSKRVRFSSSPVWFSPPRPTIGSSSFPLVLDHLSDLFPDMDKQVCLNCEFHSC